MILLDQKNELWCHSEWVFAANCDVGSKSVLLLKYVDCSE